MAKTKKMELIKGVSVKQHIELHSIVYSGDRNDRHLSIQFARWGSQASFEAGERPMKMYRPLILRGKALKMFKKQKNMIGAAWGMLDLVIAGAVPKNMASDLSASADLAAELTGPKVILEAGEAAFVMDLKAG